MTETPAFHTKCADFLHVPCFTTYLLIAHLGITFGWMEKPAPVALVCKFQVFWDCIHPISLQFWRYWCKNACNQFYITIRIQCNPNHPLYCVFHWVTSICTTTDTLLLASEWHGPSFWHSIQLFDQSGHHIRAVQLADYHGTCITHVHQWSWFAHHALEWRGNRWSRFLPCSGLCFLNACSWTKWMRDMPSVWRNPIPLLAWVQFLHLICSTVACITCMSQEHLWLVHPVTGLS